LINIQVEKVEYPKFDLIKEILVLIFENSFRSLLPFSLFLEMTNFENNKFNE